MNHPGAGPAADGTGTAPVPVHLDCDTGVDDALAAAIAVGGVRATLAPVVEVVAGHPPLPGACTRVVLTAQEDFAPDLIDTLRAFADGVEHRALPHG